MPRMTLRVTLWGIYRVTGEVMLNTDGRIITSWSKRELEMTATIMAVQDGKSRFIVKPIEEIQITGELGT